MDTKGVQELVVQIDKFLEHPMINNLKDEETIRKIREDKVVEVTVHGSSTEKVSLEWLEEKFKKEGLRRTVVPSHDILQYNAKFPLHETSENFMKELRDEYEKRMLTVEATIEYKEPLIAEQLSKHLTAQETADDIIEMFDVPNETVKRKMKREIEEALKEVNQEVQKTKIIKVVSGIFSDGIGLDLIAKNKAKWGALNNRRGQIGENKTMAALVQVLENFPGISVMGMKTHSYLVNFLENLNIQLTYRNEYDPVSKKIKKTNEVEHDNITTWMEEDTLVVAMLESKTMEIKPSKENPGNKTQAAIKHAKEALKQVLKDFKTFKDLFPDISQTLMEKIRYLENGDSAKDSTISFRFKYFVALSDVSCKDWPKGSAVNHILFKGT